MACLELEPYKWSQGAVVISVCVCVCVLTLCHSLTGRSVKSVGTCLFLVGLKGVKGEKERETNRDLNIQHIYHTYICTVAVGDITNLLPHYKLSSQVILLQPRASQ